MIPSYRVFGANRVSSRNPSLLIGYRVQKGRSNAVPLAPASKERLQKDSTMRRGSLRLAARLAVSVLAGLALSSIAAPTGSPIAYTTLHFGTSGTFLTGIRGNNIVGNYVIPGNHRNRAGSSTISTRIWAPFPEATANGANFPGAIFSSPYGPPALALISAFLGPLAATRLNPLHPMTLATCTMAPRGRTESDDARLSKHGKGANPVHDSSRHIRQPDRIRSLIGQSAENPKITCKLQN
jgi:hypothetical protein